MRQAVVELSDFKVTINELRIKDILKVITNIKEVFADEDLDIQKLAEEKFDIIVEIAGGFIVVPEGHSLDELAFSDIDLMVEPFKEVNQSFLDKLSSMGLTAASLLPPTLESDLLPTELDEESTTQ